MRRERPDIVYIGYVGCLGGEGNQLFTLARAAAASGRKTHIVLPDFPKVREFTALFPPMDNLTVERTPLMKFDTGMQNPADVLRLMAPHRNAPVLHLHTGDICLPRLTSLSLALLRPPNAFVTIHCAYPEMAFGSARARSWAAIARRYLRAVISPSHEGRTTQIAYGVPEDKAVAIHNGIEIARYAGGDGAAARRSLGLNAETPLIVWAARTHPQKRPLDAVKIIRAVAAGRPDVHFAFIGSGPMDMEVDAALRDFPGPERLHRLPEQSNIPDWLAAATVWLFPTERENFSLAVIEAMAAGCAIVSTNCAGNNEILRDGENALALPVGDTEGMTRAVLCLLDAPALRARLHAAARKTAANFTRETMVAAHLKLYR